MAPKVSVLKFEIKMPSANFRVMQSRDPRRTYPLPPYSTIIGLLANIIGKKEDIDMMLSVPFALGIASKHGCITREYTWLRNLNAKAHKKCFFSSKNRRRQGAPEHPGGQIPITVEVLNDVEVIIYLQHPNPEIKKKLLKNFCMPDSWLSHLHLGRAEDWLIIEDVKMVDLLLTDKPKHFQCAASYHQWLPYPQYAFGVGDIIKPSDYEGLYQKVQGNAVLVTSFYTLVELDETVIRNFDHVPARLCCCQIPFLDDLSLPLLLADEELNLPVFLCYLDQTAREEGLSYGR